MRKIITTKTHTFFFVIALILLLCTFVIPTYTATENQDNQLIIFLFESDSSPYVPLQENIVVQGKNYDIAVRHANEYNYAYDVTITLTPLQKVYITNQEMPVINFTAPNFDQHNEFIIRASKQGFESSEKQVLVSKGELIITFDRETVEEQGSFCITVTDQNNNAIPEAIAYLTNYNDISEITDTNGKAYIRAPQVSQDSDIPITVVKSGYQSNTRTLRVIHTQNTIVHTILSSILNISPIIIAFILLLLSIIIVKIRKNKPGKLPSKTQKTCTIRNKKMMPPKNHKKQTKDTIYTTQQTSPAKENKASITSKGSHVEIIRIRNNDCKQKEVKQLIEPKKQIKKDPKKQFTSKKSEYEWFNGTEYMKYKIDKLTGDENQSCVDKWFEGEDMFQFKLDKKVTDKKQKKKQNKESV